MKTISALALLLACSVSQQVLASNINVTPTSLRANDSTKAQVLTLTNKAQAAVSFQVQIYAWTQVDGQDSMQPTRDVIASPSIVQIAPGAKQVVRIVRLAPATGKSAYYRVVARELPSNVKPTKSTVALLVNHDLPASFEPANAASSALSLKRQGSQLGVTNTGGTAARLSRVATTDGTVLAEGALGWALPGSMKLVPIKTFEGSQVVLTVNGKPQTLSVE